MSNEILARVRFTATLIEYDDSTDDNGNETNVYGEPCVAGCGQIMSDGWYNPTWDRFAVSDDPEYALVHEIDRVWLDEWADDRDLRAPYDVLLEAVIESVIADGLGAIDSYDGFSAYAADAEQDYRSGASVMVAAHVERPSNSQALVQIEFAV